MEHLQPKGLSVDVAVVAERVVVIHAAGEIDRSNAAELSDSLRRVSVDSDKPIVVDLGEVDLLDSSGISVLLNALRRLARSGRQLLVACPPGPVRNVFELTGLTATFALFASRQAALQSAA